VWSKANTPREPAYICGDFSESAPDRGLDLGARSGGERALHGVGRFGVDVTAALAAPSIHLYFAAQCVRAAGSNCIIPEASDGHPQLYLFDAAG
jgi:hypothetical protein